MARCFVVQGFGKKTDYTDGRVLDLDASYAVIKEAVEQAGHECLRADEIVHTGTIDLPMYEQLLRADLVIADLSTQNVNAAFELGVRYGLRPHATIIVAEEGFKHPFDVSHLVIRRYKHLGEDIGRKEALRFQTELKTVMAEIVGRNTVDSPVYTFLNQLLPPQERAALEQAVADAEAAVAESAVPAAAAPADDRDASQTAKMLLETALAKISPPTGQPSDFPGARALLEIVRQQRPHDGFVVQQLVLATYKSRQPTALEALKAARTELLTLEPATTNDPETLGLWGAIHKRLWDLEQRPEQLSESISGYSRGFYLKQDYYNGINFAVLLELRALEYARAGNRDEAITDRVLARRVREEVLRFVKPQLADLSDLPRDKRYWLLASLWEVNVGLGRDAEAARWEAEARTLAPATWMLQTTEEQLDRVRRTQGDLAARLAAMG